MPLVTSIPDFVDGVQASADYNSYIKNPIAWLLGVPGLSKPNCSVRASGLVTLSVSGDWNTIPWDVADYDDGEDDMWDGGLPEIITFPVTGKYHIGANVRTAPTTANKALRALLNGTDVIAQHDNIGVATPAFTSINIARDWKFTAGDTLEIQVFHDNGATLDLVNEGFMSPVAWARWVGIFD